MFWRIKTDLPSIAKNNVSPKFFNSRSGFKPSNIDGVRVEWLSAGQDSRKQNASYEN
jgi:hypothetical protein